MALLSKESKHMQPERNRIEKRLRRTTSSYSRALKSNLKRGSRLTSAMGIECGTGNAGGMARFLNIQAERAKSYNSYSFSAWFVNRSVESENVEDATQAALAAS
jgi:hypothetical protein